MMPAYMGFRVILKTPKMIRKDALPSLVGLIVVFIRWNEITPAKLTQPPINAIDIATDTRMEVGILSSSDDIFLL